MRKGTPKPFVDGADLCSPGRWPINRRRLPDNDLAHKLQSLVLDALKDFAGRIWKKEPKKDLKHVLAMISTGRMAEQPFPEDLIANLRMDLCSVLKAAGHGDGLPQEGDVVAGV